jgi:hypothetical protein
LIQARAKSNATVNGEGTLVIGYDEDAAKSANAGATKKARTTWLSAMTGITSYGLTGQPDEKRAPRGSPPVNRGMRDLRDLSSMSV